MPSHHRYRIRHTHHCHIHHHQTPLLGLILHHIKFSRATVNNRTMPSSQQELKRHLEEGATPSQGAQTVLGFKLDSNSTHSNTSVTSQEQVSSNKPQQIPLCPVCRFRIIPERLGLAPIPPSQLCSRHCDWDSNGHDTNCCDNMRFLSQGFTSFSESFKVTSP
jgi:hypothetical protein